MKSPQPLTEIGRYSHVTSSAQRSPAAMVRAAAADGPDRAMAEQLVSLAASGSFAADQYRTLRHTIDRMRSESGLQVLAVTSSCPGDGKSVTALNVAGTLAQSATVRVLIIDADLRRPSVADYLALGGGSADGLVEAIQDPSIDWVSLVHRLERVNLSVLPAGAPQSAPYELLNSPRLETLLAEARRRYDYVLLDTPPLVPFPDGRVLSRWVDGFLLVVAAHRTPRRLVAEALNLLDPAKMIGVVFNGDDRSDFGRYGYSGYRDSYYNPTGKHRRHRW